MDQDDLKTIAAQHAVELVEPNMKIGLGTGSTAAKFVELLGEKVAGGLKVVCVPTSEATRKQAAGLNIPLATLDDLVSLDLTVDGADEIDNELNLIKGGGGALLREKIVAMASENVVIIADDTKFVKVLGAFPLPIEIVPFGMKATIGMIDAFAREYDLHGPIQVRHEDSGKPFVTDGGNYIVDCGFGAIPDPIALSEGFALVPGIVDHGLFIGIADKAFIAGQDGLTILEAAN